MTPAEQETRTYSCRFARHALDSRIVAKVLQSREWQIANCEHPLIFKVFPHLGIKACFEFLNVGYFISETEIITSDRIYFQPISSQFPSQSQWLALSDIPPVIFSEVMRDADLVVSVAQRQGNICLSAETYQQRSNLVELLLADLGIPNVTVEGHLPTYKEKLVIAYI